MPLQFARKAADNPGTMNGPRLALEDRGNPRQDAPVHDIAAGAAARMVAETVPVGLAAVNGVGRLVFANAALARTLGYSSPKELTSVPLQSLHRSPELALDIFMERLESGALEGMEWDLLRKDGSTVRVRLNARVLRPTQDELILVGSVEDITAPLEAQEESAHTQKMEAVARFAAGVAHDYNNLLTSIIGETRQLLVDTADKADPRPGLSAILKAARRATKLTQRLLVFAKSEVVRTEVLDLSRSVRGLEASLRGILPQDVDLVWRLEEAAGHARMAPRHLEHIVANLVTNARDAMPVGGAVVLETGRVVAPEDTDGMDFHPPVTPGEYVYIAVGDRGVGMNRETRRRIFDPFFTTKSIGEGAGLGLTTVYALVQRAKGHISVISAPAYGTVARVLFPLAEAEETPDRGDRRRMSRIPERTPTLLVVDDDDAVRRVMVRLLSRSGYEVLEAPDALVAQDMVRSWKGHIDLLVTDVMMPRVKGTELARWLEKVRPDASILLVSGYVDSEMLQNWVDADPDVFLAKPFEPEELLDRVRLRLQQR